MEGNAGLRRDARLAGVTGNLRFVYFIEEIQVIILLSWKNAASRRYGGGDGPADARQRADKGGRRHLGGPGRAFRKGNRHKGRSIQP